MIANRFLSAIYDRATVGETGLTDHFVGVFVANNNTFTFYEADYRTLELRVNGEAAENGRSPCLITFRDIKCLMKIYFRIDETVMDSNGSKLEITGTGRYNTSTNTLLIALKINDNGVVRYERLDLKKTVEI